MQELMVHYLSTLGLLGLMAGVFVESMGVPFPGGFLIILAGFLVGQGKLNLFHVLGTAVLGYVLGSTAAYLIGRFVGESFFIRCGKYLHITPEAFNQAQAKIENASAAFIILGRFIPGFSNISPYLAGISNLSLTRFALYNSIFAFIWIGVYAGVGAFFGHESAVISSKLQVGLPVMALALMVIYFGAVVFKRWLSSRKKLRV